MFTLNNLKSVGRVFKLPAMVMILSAGSYHPAFAQSGSATVNETDRSVVSDGADRILLAGQLRTLTQQVAAASCAIVSGVDVDEAYNVMEQATTNFDRYIVALRDGDEAMQIHGPEQNARISKDIEHVQQEWLAIHGAVDAVLADRNDVDAAHEIDDHNMQLLELTTVLSTDVSGRYADPYEVSARDALLIEIAGRQLMLTQRMAKDSCEIWSGYNSEAAKIDLAATMEVFESSLTALRFGLDAVGVIPAPNDVIRDDLDTLLARWDVIKENQQTLVDGGELNDEQKTEIFHDLLVELDDLEHLLQDYKEYAERGT